MSAVPQTVQPQVPAAAREKTSLLARMASKYEVDPRQLFDTLKQVAFRQRPDRDGRVQEVTNEQMVALMIVADQYGLNPFLKQIYAYPDKGSIVPVLGVDGWINMVQSHPQFAGEEFFESEQTDEKGRPLWIGCRMWRRDRDRPTEVREYIEECYRPTDPWNKSPRRMLRHRAYIQCARVAFGFSFEDPDSAEGVINGDFKVVPSSGADPLLADMNDRIAKRRAQQTSTAEDAKVDGTTIVDSNTSPPTAPVTPDSGGTNAAVSEGPSTGGAPATAAPAAQGDKGKPHVTQAQLHDRMKKAAAKKDLELLDTEASLIDALPGLDQQRESRDFYLELRKPLAGE